MLDGDPLTDADTLFVALGAGEPLTLASGERRRDAGRAAGAAAGNRPAGGQTLRQAHRHHRRRQRTSPGVPERRAERDRLEVLRDDQRQRDDMAHNGATRAQEPNGYRLARAYYGWTFAMDPTEVTCQ
ncbi:MAG: hypothetical protein E6I92_07040 [Chloroflexi bacterium]|nr:MAG: hypothetical protein E6I92_07040 [Chloroflexota bacterium]